MGLEIHSGFAKNAPESRFPRLGRIASVSLVANSDIQYSIQSFSADLDQLRVHVEGYVKWRWCWRCRRSWCRRCRRRCRRSWCWLRTFINAVISPVVTRLNNLVKKYSRHLIKEGVGHCHIHWFPNVASKVAVASKCPT